MEKSKLISLVAKTAKISSKQALAALECMLQKGNIWNDETQK